MTGGFVKEKYRKMYLSMLMSWSVCVIGAISDTIISGLYISSAGVSAIGIVRPIAMFILFLSELLGVGCANKFINYVGNFNKEKAKSVVGTGIVSSLAAGIIFAIALYCIRDMYLNFFGVTGGIYEMAKEYYDIYVILMILLPIYYVSYYLISADGDASRIVLTDTTDTLSNIVFSIILVQKFGIKGIAYGAVIGIIIGAAVMSTHYFSKRNSVSFKLDFDLKIFKEMCSSGSSMSLSSLYAGLIELYMNKYIIDHFGEEYIALSVVICMVISLGQVFICGIDSASSFVGVSYGEKNDKGVKKIMRLCNKYTVITAVNLSIILSCFAKFIPTIYDITQPDLIYYCVYAFHMISLSFIGIGFVYIWIGYFPKINKTYIGNILAFTYMLVAPIVFINIFAKWWSFKGLVWAFFVSPFVALVIGSVLIIHRYGLKAFPYALEENNNLVYIYEFAINEKEISILLEKVKNDLKENHIPSKVTNKVELILEETLMIVKRKNTNKKNLLGDCSIIINDKEVNVITRDNGIIFNIIEESEASSSLGHYVTSRLISDSKVSAYLLTNSYNRNSYIWKKQ